MKHLLIIFFLFCVSHIMGASPIVSPVRLDHPEKKKDQASFNVVLDVQMQYANNGVLVGKKINFLKYSCIESWGHLFNYTLLNELQNIRIISAVVEARGKKYTFFNATPSDDKLWAYKWPCRGKNGQKVLIFYDINDPSMFGVVNWDPSEEEYDYYNTKDGQVSNEKYLRWIKFLPYSSNIESPIFYDSHIYKTHSQKTHSH
ncbi:MAG: hypothetical protein U0K71_02895 [Paludibacteraceae bacterium]|nr:hypothetical protein [Paludibacteraceae bacterium]